MKGEIKFGTDGWRGVIALDFTFNNVRLVSDACAKQFLDDLKNNRGVKNTVFVGYDRRFLSKEFANCAADVLSQNGLGVKIYEEDVPTPMVSFDIRDNSSVGGIVITASHNPPEFSGFKVKRPSGASASSDYTTKIEKRINAKEFPGLRAQVPGQITWIDPSKNYLDYIRSKIDIERLKKINETIIVDPMHGTGDGYVEKLLSGGKIKIRTIRSNRDVNFGGMNPEPMMPQLQLLCDEAIRNNAFIGLATDGDADRFGAVDERGEYINTHKLLSILLYYLVEKKKLSGGVVVTVSQSVVVKRMAKKYGLKIYEVPVGFKNIAELMLKEDILIGGEEANGIGCKLHAIPDRDGIFNSILLLEAISSFGLRPSELIANIYNEFGNFHYGRIDLHIPKVELGKEFVDLIRSNPPKEINGLKVKDVSNLDGVKLIMEDDSWLLFRASGTEPLLRIYSEVLGNKHLAKNLSFGENLFSEKMAVC